jgi:hypothetical protein
VVYQSTTHWHNVQSSTDMNIDPKCTSIAFVYDVKRPTGDALQPLIAWMDGASYQRELHNKSHTSSNDENDC